MGLIRSGNTELTPLSDDNDLRQYRTEIVRILRRQIFRQIVQIERRRADARQAKFVQDDGKYASKMRTKP